MESPAPSAASASVVTLRKSRRGRYRCVSHASLKNNLLAGVGYLELANAGDFAANVWNEIPVPRHAMILMAIGGPIALSVSLVAARDYYLSWQNVKILLSERKALNVSPCPDKTTEGVLGVNFRELGTELIDRMFMDLLLGIGALLVGTGTIMAIWGANRRVFEASNLMSGFIGNGFAAFFGLVNAVWSAYLVYRFQVRYSACLANPAIAPIRMRVLQRYRRLQWHSAINGFNGLVAGMASMVTARMWWGYVVLIPCVMAMIAGNLFWRRKLGYNRPIKLDLCHDVLEDEKPQEHDACCDILDTMTSTTVAQHTLPGIVRTAGVNVLLAFIVLNQLFESFCVWVSREWPDHRAFNPPEKTLHISHYDLLGGPGEDQARMAAECRRFLSKVGSTLLEHRQRYLLELAGEVAWKEQTERNTNANSNDSL
ncbi:hypothetical protein BJY01DRAFT_263803 [Aspergillus pseudoustus]|uniref:Integral membrane protein n=1 Tax=Aspergillus pseudoustus TaxID=1810923 RepID=A0ABR4JXR2_9EURO